MVDFECGKCSQKFSVPSKYAGKRIRCKKCSSVNVVPGQKPADSDKGDKEMDLSLDFMNQGSDVFKALLKHEKEAPSIEATD
jgi:DNA-directed RNA polymerase subunit RPC12/RpoP